MFALVSEVVVEPGRIAGITLQGSANALQLFITHVEPLQNMSQSIDLMSRLRRACNRTTTSRCVPAGDFNFVLELEDRYRPALKKFTGQRLADAIYFLEHFRDFVEAGQTDCTR